MLEDLGCHLSRISQRIRRSGASHRTSMVFVPVRDQYVRECDALSCKIRGDGTQPDWDTLARVDQEPAMTGTDDIGIGSLKRELKDRRSVAWFSIIRKFYQRPAVSYHTFPGFPPSMRTTRGLRRSTLRSEGRDALCQERYSFNAVDFRAF